jgi:signal transduction histidine kinase
MNRRRPRLSLRARLLAALLTLTTGFLLVLGVVSYVAFSKRLDSAFISRLALNARRSLPSLEADPDSDVYAVYYSGRSHSAGLITQSSAVTRDLAAYLQGQIDARLAGAALPAKHYTPFPVTLPDGAALLAMWRLAGPASEAHQSAVPQGRAIVLVAMPLSERDGPLGAAILDEAIAGLVLIALLAVCGPWLIRRGLAPLDRMATTADEITARGDLTARMPDPGDRAEAGRLSSAINTMLDRIQQAFSARLASEEKVRQFAADASHELRTPLTTIRGYAELYRQGALGPDRLPDAMRRIEQEAGRMSRLVAELLELARLDRTSSLDLAETDLAALVRDAVADAAAVEPQRPVYAEAPPHLTAVVDEPRIRQVLANLLANVRAYTPPGTPTAVRLGRTGEGVVLEVADAGPGMSAEDAARAFDRFHRGVGDNGHGDGGQRRAGPNGHGQTGSGLGLSIVQAIARAHGGEAALESVPGRGTRVRIWLPARPTPPQSGGTQSGGTQSGPARSGPARSGPAQSGPAQSGPAPAGPPG